jgi:hypothetical protein
MGGLASCYRSRSRDAAIHGKMGTIVAKRETSRRPPPNGAKSAAGGNDDVIAILLGRMRLGGPGLDALVARNAVVWGRAFHGRQAERAGKPWYVDAVGQIALCCHVQRLRQIRRQNGGPRGRSMFLDFAIALAS